MTGIPERLEKTRLRIRAAAAASGRDADQIRLLAVSKTKPVDAIREALRCGQRAFGENYLQDALPKIAALTGADIEWHFIGRLQSNKTADISHHFAWVHSLDRLEHAERLARRRPPDLPPLQLCLQVNLSGEASKGGVAAGELPALAHAVAALPRLTLRGLMTMPDPGTDPDTQRGVYHALHDLFDGLRRDGLALDTLSMGMSGDLELAIAEGATVVRVGTDIFGPRIR